MSLMRAEQFFAHAIHATADYDAALVLTLLAGLGAADSPVRSTLTRLAADTGGALTRSQAWRATNRLCAVGLLRLQAHPRTWTEYHVDQAALDELLHRAASQLLRLTGFVGQPVKLPANVAAALACPEWLVPPQSTRSPDTPEGRIPANPSTNWR